MGKTKIINVLGKIEHTILFFKTEDKKISYPKLSFKNQIKNLERLQFYKKQAKP